MPTIDHYTKGITAMVYPWLTDAPYTKELVDRFNSLTHFPKNVDTENQRFAESKKQRLEATIKQLKRYGVNEIPVDVQHALDCCAKQEYALFVANVESRQLCPPWTVTGRANYSKVVTERKRNRAHNLEKKSYEAYAEAEKRLNIAIKRYSPHAAVSSDDPDAIEKLLKKLRNAEEMQTVMKESNKIIKAKKLDDEEKREKLRDYYQSLGWRASTIDDVISQAFTPDYAGRVGFASYQLTNNGAEIRRLKKRIEELQLRANQETTEVETENGIKILDNVEDNRLQIFFPGKPDESIRTQLKQHGFKWSPSNGCWQRMRGPDAKFWAERITGLSLAS